MNAEVERRRNGVLVVGTNLPKCRQVLRRRLQVLS
jgi:hypothetical protein